MPTPNPTATTRYRIEYDPDASFEECNGEGRPLTEEEYAENSYQACPDHPRAGTKVISVGPPQVQGCAICGRTDYETIPYEEYLQYYGNPDRHVYLQIIRQDRCPCCDSWVDGDSLSGIDFMDDNPEAGFADTTCTIDQLTGYLREVAEDLDSDAALEASQTGAVAELRETELNLTQTLLALKIGGGTKARQLEFVCQEIGRIRDRNRTLLEKIDGKESDQ